MMCAPRWLREKVGDRILRPDVPLGMKKVKVHMTHWFCDLLG